MFNTGTKTRSGSTLNKLPDLFGREEAEGLTGFKIYFSVFLTISFGEGDEKKDHSFVVDHDGNVHLVHSFSSGWKGHFTLSTGNSFL